MKKRKLFLLAFLINLVFFGYFTNANALGFKKEAFTKKYEEWLNLPEDQREGTIPPTSFNIGRSSLKSISKSALGESTITTTIPAKWDLRDHVDVEIKDQMETGECWAFSANSVVENYLKLNSKEYNFSERHLEYATARNFLEGNNVKSDALYRNVGDGGYISTAFTYYSRGSGPILEEDMPFENNEYTISVKEVPTDGTVKKVDDMIYFPEIYKKIVDNTVYYYDSNEQKYTSEEVAEIRNVIKTYIMNYGSITTSIYAPNDYYYFNPETNAAYMNSPYINLDHAVTIIGWDDNYSKNNFNYVNGVRPKKDGAYIVLNSWGDYWGDNGVYYISYEDFLVETQLRGVYNVSDINYDNIYQHDINELFWGSRVKYAANTYTATANEYLNEVMIATTNGMKANIYVSIGSTISTKSSNLRVSSVELTPGYNTVKLPKPIKLNKNNRFSIIVESIDGGSFGLEGNLKDNGRIIVGGVVSHKGESFFSDDGIYFEDIYDPKDNLNFSIKAYTTTIDQTAKFTSVKAEDGKVYTEYGGDFYLRLKTSIGLEGKDVDYKIYDSNNKLLDFEISKTNVTDTYSRITVSVPKNTPFATYKIVAITNIDGVDVQVATTTFRVYSIYEKSLTKATLTLSNTAYYYNGNEKKPTVTVKYGNKTLVKDKDYNVYYSNNLLPGTAKVTIKGLGYYTDSIAKTFKITPGKVTSFGVKSATTSSITLKWKKPSTPVNGYEIYRKTSASGTYKLKATIDKSGTLTYKDTGLTSGKTYYYKIRSYVIINGKTYYGDFVYKTTAPKLKKPVITLSALGNGKVKVSYKKVSYTTKYEIYYARSSSSNYKKLTTNKLYITKTKLTKGKKYKFKVRAYKVVDNVKIYSDYSKIKSITVK